MIAMDEFHLLKREIDALSRRDSEDRGARKELLRTLKAKFDCGSLKEAILLLKKMKVERQKVADRYELKMKQIRAMVKKNPILAERIKRFVK